jgi:hypothetical protein
MSPLMRFTLYCSLGPQYGPIHPASARLFIGRLPSLFLDPYCNETVGWGHTLPPGLSEPCTPVGHSLALVPLIYSPATSTYIRPYRSMRTVPYSVRCETFIRFVRYHLLTYGMLCTLRSFIASWDLTNIVSYSHLIIIIGKSGTHNKQLPNETYSSQGRTKH